MPPAETLELRPEVAAFAQLMERELRANDHKPGWQDEDPIDDLLYRLRQEVEELDEALAEGEDIPKEAADVANFAMMIADVCGGLDHAR